MDRKYIAYRAIDSYCQDLALRGRKVRTVEEYRYRLKMIIRALYDADLETHPTKIGAVEVNHVLTVYLAGKSTKYQKHTLQILSKWLRVTAENRVIEKMDLLWPKSIRRVTWLTPEQVMYLLDITDGVDHVVIHLAGQLGLRCEEIATLRMSDIRQPWIYVLGKGHMEGKLDRVYVHADTAQILARWISQRNGIVAETVKLYPYEPIPQTLLIHNHTKGNHASPYNRKSITNRMIRLSKRAGVGPFSVHTFRRSYATTLRRAGCDVLTIRDALRHEDIQTTLLYLKQDDEPMIKARELQKKFEEENHHEYKQ